MLIASTKKNVIKQYQRDFEKTLHKHLKISECHLLGHKGDNFESIVKLNDKMWWSSFTINDSKTSPRFWNGFGLLPFKNSGTQDIAVEINIPCEGINRRVSGMFAKDLETNDVFILHRGRIGGGRENIGKDSFKKWYRGTWVKVYEDGTNICEAILITSIYSKKAIANVFDFVKEVKQFKDEATEKQLGRQLKSSLSQSDSLSFDPEYLGSKKGRRKIGSFRQECNHGIIVNALEKWVRCKTKKCRKIIIFNNQLIDLGVQMNSNISEIYEVKTNHDRQSIYTGIGQLIFHSVGKRSINRVLVLPHTFKNDQFHDMLNRLKIRLLLYKLSPELDVSFFEL